MNLCDYHTHTPLCMHAEGTAEEYVDAAIAAGLMEYGIADHAPVQPEPFDDWRMLTSQLTDYYDWIMRAREHAADRIQVRSGLECDWLVGCEDWINQLRGCSSWDYMIGSVHYLADKWDFDNPVWLGRWAEVDVEAVWSQYWKTYEEMVRSDLFEIFGHADLIKKFGYRPKGDLRRFYEPVIEAISESRGVLEVNTAGWHKPCKEQYPSLQFLDLCAEAGVDIVVSSDAHAPAEVGRNFDEARTRILAAGFTHTIAFYGGQKYPVPLR